MIKKIVRRTYIILGGEKSDKVYYAVAPKDAIGGECFSTDIEKAFLFKGGDVFLYYTNQTVSGNDRMAGDFAYKQEVLDVEIKIIENE